MFRDLFSLSHHILRWSTLDNFHFALCLASKRCLRRCRLWRRLASTIHDHDWLSYQHHQCHACRHPIVQSVLSVCIFWKIRNSFFFSFSAVCTETTNTIARNGKTTQTHHKRLSRRYGEREPKNGTRKAKREEKKNNNNVMKEISASEWKTQFGRRLPSGHTVLHSFLVN